MGFIPQGVGSFGFGFEVQDNCIKKNRIYQKEGANGTTMHKSIERFLLHWPKYKTLKPIAAVKTCRLGLPARIWIVFAHKECIQLLWSPCLNCVVKNVITRRVLFQIGRRCKIRTDKNYAKYQRKILLSLLSLYILYHWKLFEVWP